MTIRMTAAALGALALAACLVCTPAAAQPMATADRLAAQRAAMAPLAWMGGSWRGHASVSERSGKIEMTQTERVGPFLDGSVMVVEGKAFGADGAPNGFNALAVISYDADAKAYTFTSYAQGYAQAVPFTVRPDGWSWERPAGPGRTLHYSTSNAGGRWTEVGTMTGPQTPSPIEIFRADLDHVGADAAWPAAGGLGPH